MKIGVVDDRKDVRESFVISIELTLEEIDVKGVEIINIPPFLNMEEYVQWITDEEIGAIIIDEKLEEGPISEVHVDYQGHDIGTFLNSRLPNFPLFIVTTKKGQSLVDDHLRNFYMILDRDEFTKKKNEYVNLIVNSAANYLDDNEKMLSEMEEISLKIIKGAASEDEISRINAIRHKLGISMDPESATTRKEVIDKIEAQTNQLKSLSDAIRKLIN